jgi:hypothetical protein
VLAGLVAGLALPRIGLGFGKASKVDIAELDIPGTLSRPMAWTRLLYEVVHTTSVECEPRSVLIPPDDPELFEHPFSVLIGRETLDGPTTEGLGQLARYLAYGGFLFIDETTGAESSAFDEAVRDLCGILFPTRPLSPLPTDHSVYRSFFLLDYPAGRVARFPYLEGVTVGNVSPIIYCRNDLSGALERGDDGRHRYPVVPGGEWQRREAVKLGINLILYAVTANYKKDQAHVRRLMLDGRLE